MKQKLLRYFCVVFEEMLIGLTREGGRVSHRRGGGIKPKLAISADISRVDGSASMQRRKRTSEQRIV
jgi:hypothetical protein